MPFEHRQRRIDQSQREVLIERREIHPRRPAVEGEQRLDLGCARKSALVAAVIQRLLSEVIARRQQAATLRVPQHEREHAAQVIEQAIAIALVQRDDDFAVAVGQEAVAVALELAAQLAVVVDLAVADQPDRAVGVVQRLLSAGQVDDRQPAVSERDERIVIDPFAVRPAMGQRIQHAPHGEVARRVGPVGVGIDDACDAAHWGDRAGD